MTKINIVFFGTDRFASIILEALLESSNINIDLVITQPDRRAGRKGKLQPSIVKILAEKNNLKLNQPENLSDYVLSKSDLNIVVDYGIIVPKKIIESPKYGSINIHPSFLPKYRGPSPIQTALLNGDEKSGITIMKMDEKMDHGPIIAQESIFIDPDDSYAILSNKMAIRASKLLLKVLPGYISGQIKPAEQGHDKSSACKLISREDGWVDFNKTATQIYNQFRALTPWPGVWTKLGGKRIKFLELKPSDKENKLGEIIFLENKLYIGCSSGSIEVCKLQLEGKKPIQSEAFINGYKNYNNKKIDV